jgi:hypothetical protein
VIVSYVEVKKGEEDAFFGERVRLRDEKRQPRSCMGLPRGWVGLVVCLLALDDPQR